MYLTNNKYTDYTIYNFLSDSDLLSLMLTSTGEKKVQGLNDEYFKYRIINYYGKNIIDLNPGLSFKQQYQDIVTFLYKEYNEQKLYTRLDLLIIAKEKGWSPSKNQFNKIVSLNCPEFICQVMKIFGCEIDNEYQFQDWHYFKYINTFDSAIFAGNLETVKWLVKVDGLKPTDYTLRYLHQDKHIETIKWIYKKFGELPQIDFRISPTVIQLMIELDNDQFRNQYNNHRPSYSCVSVL